MNALLTTLHSLPRGTWSDLPSRASTWSIRSPGRAPPRTFTPTRSQPTRIIFSHLEHCPPPHSSDRFRAGRRWLGPHCPRRSLQKHLPLSRTSCRRPNWTTVNVLYVRSKSRCLQGLSRFNRAPTDLTQSSPNKQTLFWTPISQPASFSTLRRHGRAPSCTSRRNWVASESQSTSKN